MKRITAIFLIITTIISLCSCSFSSRYTTQYLNKFDTVTTFTAVCDSQKRFDEMSEIVEESLNFFHQLFDIYNNYSGISNIKTINDKPNTKVVVDKNIIELISFGKQAYKNTNGNLNIAMGSVLRIWHKYRKEALEIPDMAKVPSMQQLQEANIHCNIDKISIDKEGSTIELLDDKMSLDVGAIAKGFTADEISKTLLEKGFDNFVINIGGNVVTKGEKAKNKPWIVSIQNPDINAENQIFYDLAICDLSLVTSGNYQRFYISDGIRYHHIIDPKTLFPLNLYKSISIISGSSVLADSLSTALFNMPYLEGEELIKTMDNVEAIWIFNDNSVKMTEGFEKYIKK